MSAIDHAAAHERIEDLVLEPTRLAALDTSTAPDDIALLEHVAGCPACRADLDGWRRLGRVLGQALPSSAAEATALVEPIEVPPSLRMRVVGAVHADALADGDRPASAATSTTGRVARSRRLAPWLSLAAVLVVLVGAVSLTLDQASRRASAESEVKALSGVVAAVDRILAADHTIVEMRAVDGSSAGSISWSRHDWIVLTTALIEPPSDQRYKCWLEDAGRSVLVGEMDFAGDTAYWIRSLDEWATWEIGQETMFVITLEARDAPSRIGPTVLSADLGS